MHRGFCLVFTAPAKWRVHLRADRIMDDMTSKHISSCTVSYVCVLLITRLLRGVGRWARKPVNHTSWVAVVTPTDRPKSVRNCCLIELFCGVVCVVTLPLWHFCLYRGFCHRTGSDLLPFVSTQFSNENWLALSTNTVLATKIPTDFH